MSRHLEKPPALLAIVAGDFVPTGGMDRANYALASYLVHSGKPIELVAHRVTAELAKASQTVVHLVPKPCGSYFLGQWLLAFQGRRVGRRVASGGGRVVVNGGNCTFGDVNWVHYVHAVHQPSTVVSFARRLKRRLEHPLNLRDESRSIRSARLVLCNSRRTQDDVVEYIGVPRERTRVVYYGNDPNEFYPADVAARSILRSRLDLPEDRPLAVFVGALGDRRKGFDTLHAAWVKLCSDVDWDAVLVVVGAGAELDGWRRKTAACGLSERIRYLGFRTDVPNILRAADLLVAPTRYEAYGLGVQEAICCGLPTIVSAKAGVAERYPHDLRHLLLENPDDDDALVALLRNWHCDVDGYRTLIAPFAAVLRSHTWDDMSREIIKAMELDADSHGLTLRTASLQP